MNTFLKELKQKIVTKEQAENLNFYLEKGNVTVSNLNPYVYLISRKQPDFFKDVDYLILDGISLVVLFKIIGVNTKRVSVDMTSLSKKIFEQSETNGTEIYFLGTEEDKIKKAVFNIKDKYPNLNLVGYRNGYFKNDEEKVNACENVNKSKAKILLLGMGTPYQEEFLNFIKKSSFNGVTFTCGGFFHQTATGLDYYPKYVDKYHLRFLYRMYDERRIFFRNVKTYPIFMLMFLIDLIKK